VHVHVADPEAAVGLIREIGEPERVAFTELRSQGPGAGAEDPAGHVAEDSRRGH
jgi:hypothetical protein